jgi:HTH-type transcriptional regulator / antitoxin HipB
MHSQSRLSATIARQAKEARKQQNLRQEELALAAGVSVRTVHEIEAGKPTIRLDVLERVMTALGLTIEVARRDAVGPLAEGE